MKCEICSTSEGTVTAANNYSVNFIFLKRSDSLCHSLFGLELKTTVGVKEGSALCDNVGHTSCGERNYLLVDKSAITAHNSNNFNILRKSTSCYSSYYRIHTGSISARSKNANLSELYHNFAFRT